MDAKKSVVVGVDGKARCFGGQLGKEFYGEYHDTEWGKKVQDDRLLFEMLILEGAQAGLSWETILKRRTGYQEAFYNFDHHRIAMMTDEQLHLLCSNPHIIRNRLKIFGTRQNAQVFLKIQQEFGSFNAYVWRFATPIARTQRATYLQELPPKTAESDALSKDLKKRGMTFVGSTIIYAFMQAVGMVDDHLHGCWLVK